MVVNDLEIPAEVLGLESDRISVFIGHILSIEGGKSLPIFLYNLHLIFYYINV